MAKKTTKPSLDDFDVMEEQAKADPAAVEAYNKTDHKKNDPTVPEAERVYQPAWGGICPHCTAKEGQDVRLTVKATSGPIGYYHCTRCGYPGENRTVKIARDWRPSFGHWQMNVAARPDMK